MNSIAFANLRAEMARTNITIKDIAVKTKAQRTTLSKKLKRDSPLSLHEAYEINRNFFPDKDISYLFAEIFEEIESKPITQEA